MSRLEERGKGILLLHDIHPKTVAALPGLSNNSRSRASTSCKWCRPRLTSSRWRARPASGMLASAASDDLTIDDSETAPPIWPHAADDLTPDAVVLPVPDAAAFRTGCRVSPMPAARCSGPRCRHPRWLQPRPTTRREAGTGGSRSGRNTEGFTSVHSDEHQRVEKERRPEHSRAHARAGADGQHADLMTRIRSVAALFSPAQATR